MNFKKCLRNLLAVGTSLCLAVSAFAFTSCGGGGTKGLEYELNADGESYTVTGLGDSFDFKIDIELVIPSKYEGKPVTKIAEYAFNREPLKSVVIPDTVTEVGKGAFEFCSSSSAGGLNSITIGKGVKTIGETAFAGNGYVTSIHIPASVTEIGGGEWITGAFTGCCLETITVDEANTVFDSRNGCNAIIETATNKLIVGSAGTVIPNDVAIIGPYAFDGVARTLTNITIPASVTEICEGAFFGAYGLQSVTFNEGLRSIGKKAFFGLDNLESVTIPNSVTTLGDAAFQDCDNLTKVVIGNGVTQVDGIAFANGVNAYYIYYRGTESQWSRIKSGFKYAMSVTYDYTGD